MKKELFSLSIGQKLVAYAGRKYPGAPVNNIGGLLLFEDSLDPELLARAIEICIKRNDALRLHMHQSRRPYLKMEILLNNVIQQYLDEIQKVEVGYHDFTGCTAQEMEDTILEWNSKPIGIFDFPLHEFKIIRTPDGRTGVFSKIHHIITDAWNSTLISKEIIEVYFALLRSEKLPEPLYSFLSYLKCEEDYLKSPQYATDRDYWMNIYGTKPTATLFKGKNKKSKTGITKRINVNLGFEKSNEINDFCIQNKLSPVTFFTFLICMCLSQFTGSHETNVASPVMFRSTLKEKKTCGPMVNFQLIRFFFNKSRTFIESCKEMEYQRLTAMRHIKYPNLHLLNAIYKKYFISELFDVFVSLTPAKIETKEKIKFESKWLHSGVFANPFSIYITDIDNTGHYNLQYEYHIDTYTTEFVKGIHENLMAFLNYGIKNPSVLMKDVFQAPLSIE